MVAGGPVELTLKSQATKAKKAARDRRYYQRHKQKVLKRQKEYYEDNKEEILITRKEHYQNNRQEKISYSSRQHLLKRYNITPEDYQAMLAVQNGTCAICKQGPGKSKLQVDHDHDTGQVRGLLCVSCNSGLGHLGDDYGRVLLAAEYLRCEGKLNV